MKKIIQSLFAFSVFGAAALVSQAQPTPKIMVVDMAKLYDNHYQTVEQNSKLQADEAKAQEELERLNKEGNALVEKYKEFDEQTKNPAVTAEAKQKAKDDAQRVLEDIGRKQKEVQSFQNNTRTSLQQRIKNFRDLMIEQISKIAIEVGKRKGATLLIDKSGPTLIGVSNIIYSDPAYDITDDVLAEINKNRPATATAPATSTTSTPDTAAPAKSDSPKITLPGATPSK